MCASDIRDISQESIVVGGMQPCEARPRVEYWGAVVLLYETSLNLRCSIRRIRPGRMFAEGVEQTTQIDQSSTIEL
jgi:hypothetical protein